MTWNLYVEVEIVPLAGRALDKLDAVVARERIFCDQSVDLMGWSASPE